MNSTIDGIGTHGETAPPIQPGAFRGIMAAFILISTIFTLFRVGTRLSIHREVWWDDLATVCAMVGVIIVCIFQLRLRQQSLDGSNFGHDFERAFVSTQITIRLSLFAARLAILLLYLRAFFPAKASKNFFWWVICGTIGFNVLYSAVHILVLLLQCVRSHEPWGNVCIHESKLLIAASSINIISDVAVLIIPIGAVRKIQLSRQKKWGLLSLFSFAALAPAVSIARLVYQVKHFDTDEEAGTYAITILLATVELTIAIISGCIPVMGVICTRQRQDRPARDRSHQLESPQPRDSEDAESGGQPQSPAFVPMGWGGDISRPVGAAARRVSRFDVWWWSNERPAPPEAIELATL
ncbi:hypothetical protein SLS62_005624 [Diatrype stigma]|uniref:Rhodopsin domain-containing protein n=1 Tax=Diatrype stigma TaxID=117547 RepID=A0AAN9UR37_9PEZI